MERSLVSIVIIWLLFNLMSENLALRKMIGKMYEKHLYITADMVE